jgi:glycosyltransferase involved in cell wall biosynthesis
VSRYLFALWQDRPDLRAAFPDPIGGDAERFLEWVRADGVRQEDIPRPLRPSWPGPESEPVPDYGTARLPGVNAVGYFQAELGVGEGGRLLVSVLDAAGVEYSTFAYGETASRQEHPFVDRGPRDAPYDVNILCINADRVGAFAHEVGSSFFEGRHTVGLWAWELEDFPPSMHSGFHVVDEVWAVSSFTAAAVRRVSPKPVFELPHAIVPPVVPAGVTRSDLAPPDDRFMFLFVFDFLSVIERKNPFAVIKAFARAFAPGEGPVLVIKTVNGHLKLPELERLRAAAAAHPDVMIMDRYLSPGQRTALISLAGCYVSLHRAEGFGLTLAEAMALGKPVIATGYSGNLDFMDDENSFLVDARMVPIAPGCEPYPAGAMWAEPDVGMASRLMRLVVDEPDTAAARGDQAAFDIRTLHSPEARVPFVRQRLAEIARQRALPPPSAEPAPPRGIDELAGHLAAPPGAGAPGSRLRRLARWAALRATRPFWWGQRVVDKAILEALQEAEEGRHEEMVAVREAYGAELRAAVPPLKGRVAYIEAHLENVREDFLRVAAANDAARADLAARLDRLE